LQSLALNLQYDATRACSCELSHHELYGPFFVS
jgi:hypothetical protein